MAEVRAPLTGVVALLLTAGAHAQVQVDDGQWLRESDLERGEFNGQSFTLGPDAVFDINQGGETRTAQWR